MIWSVELVSFLHDAPFPSTISELIDWAERSGVPKQLLLNLYELKTIQENEDEEAKVYRGIEDLWPNYIQKEDFFHNQEDEGFDYDNV